MSTAANLYQNIILTAKDSTVRNMVELNETKNNTNSTIRSKICNNHALLEYLESYSSNRLTIILYDFIPVSFHNRMQERPWWDNNGDTARQLDRSSIFHDSTDIDQIFTVLVDSTAQKANESFISHDFLGDRVDEKASVDKGLAGAFARDCAFSELNEGLTAGGLGTDAVLDFAHEE